MAGKLSQLISSRANFRRQLSRIHNDVSNLPSKSPKEKELVTAKLKRIQTELERLDPQIREPKWEANLSDEVKAEVENNKEIDESSKYEDKLSECLYASSQSGDQDQGGIRDFTGHSQALSMLKSATAPLPTFNSKEGEDLTKFFMQFEEITKRFNYTEYDKYLLLKQQITGRASTLIEYLDSTQHSYQSAKELLLDALASPTIRKFNVLKEMANLKLNYSTEPFEYIGKINSIHKSFTALAMTTDDILQYFSWTGLNESFKTQLVQITNEAKPSLEKIKAKFFEANERYLNVQQQFKAKQKNKESTSKSTSLAADVKFDKSTAVSVFKSCPLSKNSKGSSHPINKCREYPDSKSKVEKLRSLRACTKCARLDHSDDSCKFHFLKRCDCGKWHFKFLCFGEKEVEKQEARNSKDTSSKIPNSEKQNVKETLSGVLVAEELSNSFKTTDCSRALLPTFSCTFPSGREIRCMRDSGCQSNFIMESRAIKENLPVIDSDIKLKVNGFNSSQIYKTKSYKVKLSIGKDIYETVAMGVPEIRTVLKLPGLSTVINGFLDKGYNLADRFMLEGKDVIGDIEFILGSNAAYCLRESLITFGGIAGKDPSIYSQTPAGIMLLGNIDQLMLNLKYLPVCTDGLTVQCSTVSVPKDKNSPVTYEDLGLHSNSFAGPTDVNSDLTEPSFSAVLDEQGENLDSKIERATEDILEDLCSNTLNYDKEKFSDEVFANEKIVNHVLNNTARNSDGRLVMPLIWNNKVDHLLGRNKNLATQILNSNFKKLSKKHMDRLKLIDQTFKEQAELGIIERINNLDQFLEENPRHSFLAHMGVFKPERETTKCRVVYLSNLCEKEPSQAIMVNHNQAMLSGPSLNQKITTALLHLRFDKKLLCFDVKKAFLNICLSDVDSNKLLFLWYKNFEKGDYTIVGYKSLRLPFGLVCSPCLLLLGLYKILMLDTDDDPDEIKKLKRHIYSLIYMDNGDVTTNSSEELKWAFEKLSGIFEPYKFFLQQFVTNDDEVQAIIDKDSGEETPEEVKLLGLLWNHKLDTLTTRPLQLDSKANTKRLVLKTIAGHYDIFGFTGPIMNRARLFLHKLQCDTSLSWDSKLSEENLRDWKNICKQVNSSPAISIDRFVGRRDGIYRLIAFTDSSKEIYGTTIFIQEINSLEVNFILAKNRLVNKQLSNKSIPSLEFQAITFGTEVLIDLYQEISGSSCIIPISICE